MSVQLTFAKNKPRGDRGAFSKTISCFGVQYVLEPCVEAAHGCPADPIDACSDDLSAALQEGVVSSPIPSEGACVFLLGSGLSCGFTLWCPLCGGVSAVCDNTSCSWHGVCPPPVTVCAPALVLTARNLKLMHSDL